MELTKKQKNLIIEIRNEWLEICQSGKDITIPDVEQGVTDLYALDNRKKPLILILNDPLQCQYLANILSKECSQINSQIHSQIHSQRLQWFDVLGALSWRSGYMGEFDYYIKSGLLKLDEKQKQLCNQQINFLKSGVWELIVFDNVCIISKTPTTKRDDIGRLHSLTSKAVEFRSGYGFYTIHGVVFDESLWNKVKDRKLTPKQLLSMKNTDQRFVAMNHYGFERLIDGMDKKLLDKSKYGNELYSFDFNGVELRFLSYPDIDTPTKRRISFVNPILESASDAMSWKHNCTEEEYNKMEVLKTWC